MERDNDNTSPSQGQGNLDNSAAIGSGGMGGAAGGPNLGLGPGGGGGIPGMLGGGGGGGGGDFGGSRSGAGSGRHGTSAEWEMGNAVAGRLDEMRARELGASLRATVQENEAMRRNLEFAQVSKLAGTEARFFFFFFRYKRQRGRKYKCIVTRVCVCNESDSCIDASHSRRTYIHSTSK